MACMTWEDLAEVEMSDQMRQELAIVRYRVRAEAKRSHPPEELRFLASIGFDPQMDERAQARSHRFSMGDRPRMLARRQQHDLSEWVSVREMAALCGLTSAEFRGMIRAGEVPPHQATVHGDCELWPRAELPSLIAQIMAASAKSRRDTCGDRGSGWRQRAHRKDYIQRKQERERIAAEMRAAQGISALPELLRSAP